MYNQKAIVEELRQHIKTYGIKQKTICAKVGITEPTLTKILNHVDYRSSEPTLSAIVDYLNSFNNR